jgi:hypothetical protein
MSEQKKILKKLHKRIAGVIEEDNPELDLDEMRHAFLISVVVETGDRVCLMQYKIDPECKDGTPLIDQDMVSTIATMAHGTSEGMLKKVVNGVTEAWIFKDILNKLRD